MTTKLLAITVPVTTPVPSLQPMKNLVKAVLGITFGTLIDWLVSLGMLDPVFAEKKSSGFLIVACSKSLCIPDDI